jgi:chromosome segregation ATPase
MFGTNRSTNFLSQPSRISKTRSSKRKSVRELSPLRSVRKTPASASSGLCSQKTTATIAEEAESDLPDVEDYAPDSDAAAGDDNVLVLYLDKQKQLRNDLLEKEEQIKKLQRNGNTQCIRDVSHLVEVADLKGKINSLKSEKWALKEQAITYLSEMHDLRMTASYHQDKIKSLNGLMVKAQQELSLLRNGSTANQRDYDHLKTEYDNLKLRFDVGVSKTNTGSPTSKKFAATKDVAEDRDRSIRLTSQINFLQNDSTSKQRVYASEIKSLKSTIEQRETQISQQQSRLAVLHKQVLHLHSQTTQLQNQVSTTTMMIAIPEAQTLETQTAGLKEQYDKLYAAATDVAREGNFLANGGFGDVGIALEKMKSLLKD